MTAVWSACGLLRPAPAPRDLDRGARVVRDVPRRHGRQRGAARDQSRARRRHHHPAVGRRRLSDHSECPDPAGRIGVGCLRPGAGDAYRADRVRRGIHRRGRGIRSTRPDHRQGRAGGRRCAAGAELARTDHRDHALRRAVEGDRRLDGVHHGSTAGRSTAGRIVRRLPVLALRLPHQRDPDRHHSPPALPSSSARASPWHHGRLVERGAVRGRTRRRGLRTHRTAESGVAVARDLDSGRGRRRPVRPVPVASAALGVTPHAPVVVPGARLRLGQPRHVLRVCGSVAQRLRGRRLPAAGGGPQRDRRGTGQPAHDHPDDPRQLARGPVGRPVGTAHLHDARTAAHGRRRPHAAPRLGRLRLLVAGAAGDDRDGPRALAHGRSAHGRDPRSDRREPLGYRLRRQQRRLACRRAARGGDAVDDRRRCARPVQCTSKICNNYS